MSHVIPLDIPDDLYQRLAEMADRRGQSPDELVLAIVDREVRVADNGQAIDNAPVAQYDPQADPLARFAGIFASDEPGWADRHDAVFGGESTDANEK